MFEAVDPNTGERIAIKRTSKSGEYVSREFEVLDRLKGSQHVVQMLNIFYSKNSEGKIVQNLVFEFCDTNLEEVIQKAKENKRYIPMEDIRNYMRQILTGMAYVHKQGVCHRDLKPENILKNEKGVVKICDFGSAKILSPDGLNTPYIVSRYYRAPELILACSDYTNKIDIWGKFMLLLTSFSDWLHICWVPNTKTDFPGQNRGKPVDRTSSDSWNAN